MLNYMTEMTDNEQNSVSGGTSLAARWEHPGSYTVKAGDTLTKIAIRYGTTWEDLARHNRQIKNPRLIIPGDVIKVPAA